VGDVLIDLGEDREPGGSGGFRAPVGWRPVLAVVALSLLTGLGGATRSRQPDLVPIATVPTGAVSAVLLTPSTVYVAQQEGTVRILAAYALPGGERRWRLVRRDPVRSLLFLADSGVLLASTATDTASIGGLSIVDAGTGRLLSDRAAAVVDAPPGRRILVRQAGSAPDRIRWQDARTGAVVWSRDVPPQVDVSAAHDPARPGPGAVLTTDPDGTANVLAEDTGALVVTGQVGSLVGSIVLTPGPPGATPAPSASRAPMRLLGNEFLVQQRRGTGTDSLTAFDLDTLRSRFTVTGDAMSLPVRCGALLCIGAAQGVRAVDPVTGTVRWRSGRWQYVSPLGAGRLVGYAVDGALGVLDPGTGSAVLDLGTTWRRVLVTADGGAVLGRADRARPDRFWLARLRSDPATVRPLGYLSDVDAQSCQASVGLIACGTRPGVLGVWRYPTSAG
jgi:hypothetical protein